MPANLEPTDPEIFVHDKMNGVEDPDPGTTSPEKVNSSQSCDALNAAGAIPSEQETSNESDTNGNAETQPATPETDYCALQSENNNFANIKIHEEEGQGRYLVAARDVEAGQVLLEDYPLVAGPLYTRSKPVCLGCLKFVNQNSYRCSECGFPLCSPECEESPYHKAECRVFKAASFKLQIEDWTKVAPIYSCISVLRGLLLAEVDPAAWKVLDSFMDHDEDRKRKDSPTWKVHEIMVTSYVIQSLNLTQFTQENIRRVTGILRTNAVKLESRVGHGDGIAVYPTYSYTNHSCICNTHTRKFKDHKLQLIAQVPIKKGEIVWTRYTTPQIGNFQRTLDIQRTWHFQCSCPRCTDPTEFGTMMSGVICNKNSCCGVLLPLFSNTLGSPWSCGECGRKVGVSTIQKIFQDVTEDIGRNREQPNQQLLDLVDKYAGSVLHRNNYLLLGVKEIVLQRLMARISVGDRLEEKVGVSGMSSEERREMILLRTRLFRDIVHILDKVDSPGANWIQKLAKMEKEEVKLLQQLAD